MEPSKLTIKFAVNYATTPDQSVYVVGSIPEFGGWDVKKGLLLKKEVLSIFFSIWSDLKGESWRNSLELAKKDAPIEYKYVAYDPPSHTKKWEEGENRVLDLSIVKESKKEVNLSKILESYHIN